MEPSETEDCPLCYNTMKDETPLKKLSCKHEFHKECIEDIILYNIEHSLQVKCPLCREPIGEIDYPLNWREHLPVIQQLSIPPRRIITNQDWPFNSTAPPDYIRLNDEDSTDFRIYISHNPLRLTDSNGNTIVDIGELCPIHSIQHIELPPIEQNVSIETIRELESLSWRNTLIAYRDVRNARLYNNNSDFKRDLAIILGREQLPIEELYNQRILAIANEEYRVALELYDAMKIRKSVAETMNLNDSIKQEIAELPTNSTTIYELQEVYKNARELYKRAREQLGNINRIHHIDVTAVASAAITNLNNIHKYLQEIKSQLDDAKTRLERIKLSIRDKSKRDKSKHGLLTIKKKARQIKDKLLGSDAEMLGGKSRKHRKFRKSRKYRKSRKH